ncbi:MAG TPA: hypothetical protein P5567_00385 [Kiritimatiellia bacterium]|nr:hypothetical protein [Kiritimatiellia bacterium]HRZ10891.1 hypothetical protein [Kiritimatiellia bacterium]HSA18836.1 hypothetical protein [Kiritimatiellia bacterium]
MNDKSKNNRAADLVSDSAIVEVKASLTAARGLRDALTSLAITLAEQQQKRGYLLLLDPGLSKTFLETELQRLKVALRPGIAERLHLVAAKGGKLTEGTHAIPQDDYMLLRRALNRQEDQRTGLPAPNKQNEVFLLMIHQWVTGKGPMTSKWLEDTVGCHYRTVANAIDQLGHAVQRHSDRSVSFKYFPEQDWGRLLAVAQKTRATMLYADASDQPRSPESLLRRMKSLNRKDIAVGGVLGTKRYYNELDIVGTPRLDLCIHCPDNRVDLGFVHMLDPALERTRDTHRPARLAIHFVRRQDALFDRDQNGAQWADPVECLLELYHARLDQQARSFQEFLSARGRELSGKS